MTYLEPGILYQLKEINKQKLKPVKTMVSETILKKLYKAGL